MNQTDLQSIDLNLLKVFEALYEEGGAGRAALRLGLTQSAVSAALRRLREIYQDALFMRTGRGLAPSTRADELKPVISEALDRCRQSLALAMPAHQDYRGRSIAVGLSDDFELAIARWLMRRVAQTAPGLRLIFRQTHSHIVADALLKREIDLAIASGGFSPAGLSHRTIGAGRYACLVDAQTAPARNGRLTLAEFVARGHILVSSGGVIGIVDQALAAQGMQRQVCASTTHFAGLPWLLCGSESVATLPAHAAQAIASLTGLCLLPCPLALPAYPIELGWRTHRMRDAALTLVLEAVSEAFVQPALATEWAEIGALSDRDGQD
ncbi:LysR family transcriptional regulator [Affinibrenneria salicis]|uniref:LysR family transcriptional regulator n=2 Tax=Affinibrenneria salicis TaxID=2590031 RepID=A0A5J5FWJ4_9GAMM|nr:LysR family transcriptional regulator [Affinibrenneria salicis]